MRSFRVNGSSVMRSFQLFGLILSCSIACCTTIKISKSNLLQFTKIKLIQMFAIHSMLKLHVSRVVFSSQAGIFPREQNKQIYVLFSYTTVELKQSQHVTIKTPIRKYRQLKD